MISLTRRDVLAHQAAVPWPSQRQVEQDLLLCQTMVALFDDAFLQGQIAMRGGTLLHKVHLAPAARYSEDIDLVVVGDRPEGHIRRALNRVLSGVLGTPKQSVWGDLKLAIRNTVKPSRVLRMTYAVPSLMEPGTNLEIVVEANITERTPHLPVIKIPFEFPFRDAAVGTQVSGYDIHEMLGTKMRALFQRRRGRDLRRAEPASSRRQGQDAGACALGTVSTPSPSSTTLPSTRHSHLSRTRRPVSTSSITSTLTSITSPILTGPRKLSVWET